MPEVQNNLSLKRQSEPEDSRHKEKEDHCEADVDIVRNDSRSATENLRSDSLDKENELRKPEAENGESRDSYPEVIRTESPQKGNLKMIFKKEVFNDASNDSEDVERDVSARSETKDVIQVSRLLIKPKMDEEALFRFREFSPNFLEAISNLKSEERGMYSRMLVRRYQDAERLKSQCNGDAEDYTRRKAPASEEEESRNGSRSEEEEEEEEDETVDIETTDDLPPEDSPPRSVQVSKPSFVLSNWIEIKMVKCK